MNTGAVEALNCTNHVYFLLVTLLPSKEAEMHGCVCCTLRTTGGKKVPMGGVHLVSFLHVQLSIIFTESEHVMSFAVQFDGLASTPNLPESYVYCAHGTGHFLQQLLLLHRSTRLHMFQRQMTLLEEMDSSYIFIVFFSSQVIYLNSRFDVS